MKEVLAFALVALMTASAGAVAFSGTGRQVAACDGKCDRPANVGQLRNRSA